jgi:hypothetical protein
MNEVNLSRWGGGLYFNFLPPRHLPSAGKLIRQRFKRFLIRATPPVQEGNFYD